MGGCTNCKGKAGCDHRKGAMFATLDTALAALFPSRTWGEVDAGAVVAPFSDPAELEHLCDEIAQTLGTFCYVVRDESPGLEGAHYIYCLAFGRPPAILAARDGRGEIADEWQPGDTVDEQYLRVCISRKFNVVGVQEIAVRAEVEASGLTVTEEIRSGVFSAPLLPRMQKLVALFPAYDLTHLDFGELTNPPADFAPGVYQDHHPGVPTTANYFFSIEPADYEVVSWIPR